MSRDEKWSTARKFKAVQVADAQDDVRRCKAALKAAEGRLKVTQTALRLHDEKNPCVSFVFVREAA